MKARMALGAFALAAGLIAGPEAYAKEPKKDPGVELARPEGSSDPDARGVVKTRKGRRGEETILRLSRLDPRSTYEVRDGSTGESLGEVRTNRKGRANFNLTRRVAKAASSRGSDAVDAPDDVEIWDVEGDECVLEGGIDGDLCEGLASGWADYENEAGDYASAFLESAPAWDSEFFSFSFFLGSEDDKRGTYFDFTRDTASGDDLPLGAESAEDLAGREFEVRDPDGAVVFEGTLPELEEWDCDWLNLPEDDGSWDDWGFGDDWDWSGDWGSWDDFGSWDDWGWDDWSWQEPADDLFRDPFGGNGLFKSARRDAKDDEVSGHTLWIEGEDGELANAGVFREETFDFPEFPDCPVIDFGDWDFEGFEFSEIDGVLIGLIVVPVGEDFDLDAFLAALEDLLGHGDEESPPAEAASRRGRR